MANGDWEKAKRIFGDAINVAPAERPRFLDEVCDGDETVRREVESLLSSFNRADVFLEKPVVGEVAGALETETKMLKCGTRFGHYEILRQIGAGGMGEVYLAKDKKLDRKVAVKVLNEKFSQHESNLHRFTQEAKAASGLNHPNILVIHEIGESENTNYIVSEFIEGETLRERLKESPMKLSEVLDIAVQIANSLVAAHKAHLVHRDIKPENVMIRPDGLVKILDFGLAKLVEQKPIGVEETTVKQNQTAKGVILGTINYMSPEQARGEKIDARTDIFSFGVVMYEMLAGRAPFAGDSLNDVIASILKTEPAPLARFDVPKELARVVSRALRKDRDERYQHVKDLLIDLKDFQQDAEFAAKLERRKFEDSDGAEISQNIDAKTQILEVKTTAEASDEKSAANVAAGATEKQTALLPRRIFPPRRAVIYAAVLLILMLGAFGYWQLWRQTSVAPSLPQTEIKSLAVLPLKSLDSGDNYLGLGIADAVIRRISQTGGLTVRPTSAVRRYLTEETDALTAARELNADAVLEGSVQRSGDRLRVSVNLLQTGDETSLWADSFDLRMSDIFTIQDTVAQQVASRLRLQLDPAQQARLDKRSTSNPIAYEFYVKGVYSFDQRGFGDAAKPQMETTIGFFKKAIEADPNYALARAQLANAYIWKAIFIEQQAVWAERAKEEINRADALDPQLAETHVARYWLLVSVYKGWQTEAAVRELLLAQQLNPNVGHVELGNGYYHLGLEDLGDRAYQRALDIDPTSKYVKDMIVERYVTVNKYDEWLAANQKFYLDDPTRRWWYLMGKGRLDEAQKALDENSVENIKDPPISRQKAILSALKGDFRAAEAEIPSILSSRSPQDPSYHHVTYDVACVYALTGKSDEAVKWLRKTAAEGFPSYTLFERDAYLNRIRQAPEFIQFMTEMKAQYERYEREFASTP